MDSRQLEIERRVLALEAQGRRLKMFGLGCLAIALAWTCYSGGLRDEVRARSLTLVNGSDQTYAELKMTEDGPGLFLRDPGGVARLSLVHNEDETALYIRDADDQVRIGVAQFAHGGGGVALHGEAARGAAVLYFKEQGSLTFYDLDGNVVTRIPSSE